KSVFAFDKLQQQRSHSWPGRSGRGQSSGVHVQGSRIARMKTLRRAWCVLLVAMLVPAAAVPALAQTSREARLIVTVIDPSGAVIPDANVVITGIDDGTRAVGAVTAKTSDKGVATPGALTPGRYTIHAEFPGFETGVLNDVRLRPGDNKHVVVLTI